MKIIEIRRKIGFSLLFVFSLFFDSKAQVLSIDATIDYINNIFTNLEPQWRKSEGQYFSLWSPAWYKVGSYRGDINSVLCENEMLQTRDDFKLSKEYDKIWDNERITLVNNSEYLSFQIGYQDNSFFTEKRFYLSEVDFLFNDQSKAILTNDCGKRQYFKVNNIFADFMYEGPGVLMYCDESQYQTCIDGNFAISFQHISQNAYELKKLYNAFRYLKSIAEIDKRFVRNTKDIFSDENFFDQMESLSTESSIIEMRPRNGVNYVGVEILGAESYEFVFDTGASTVTVNEDIERELWASKTISRNNYVSSGLYRIADGSIVEARRLIIPKMIIGNIVVKDVLVAVTNGELLLGNSAFKDFRTVKLDKNKNTLTITK